MNSFNKELKSQIFFFLEGGGGGGGGGGGVRGGRGGGCAGVSDFFFTKNPNLKFFFN